MDENWKKISEQMRFFNGGESRITDLALILKETSFEHEADQLKLISLFSAFKHKPSPDSFFNFMSCLFRQQPSQKLQTTTLPDLAISFVLHGLDDELKDMAVETCLIGLSIFPATQLPPIVDQILRFQVPLDSGSHVVKFLSPLFLNRLSTDQQATVVTWILKQHELQHISVSDKPRLMGKSLSAKMNWISEWLDLLSQQDFRFQSPFLSLHLDVDEKKSGKKFSSATIQIQGTAKRPVDLECAFDSQGTYILGKIIEWESWLLNVTEELLKSSWSSIKRHRMSVTDLELAAEKSNAVRTSSDKFTNQLNRAKKNINDKVRNEIRRSSPSLTKLIANHNLFLVGGGFAWINTVKRPTASGLALIEQPRPSAPERSKRNPRLKL